MTARRGSIARNGHDPDLFKPIQDMISRRARCRRVDPTGVSSNFGKTPGR
ncbi:MAG TPA: hypothetical protein VKM55_19615 [Candidatus Lokiarchaeia archaeon]|nr:hypothetical protein [Candidatus Lokiarchaeia archaeon]